jgi:protein gp37
MAKDSKIEWTDHTFNPWWGCTKVSPACTNCYADAFAKRVGSRVWGPKAPRRFFGDAHWEEPLRWNRDAEREGRSQRVFCASMADVFEDRSDLDASRGRLWRLIAETSWLDWLLLTKRPENVSRMVPRKSAWPENVWLGTTVEDQKWAAERVPCLVQLPAAVRFLSCEPLLGPLDVSIWLGGRSISADEWPIDWVIAGGESGARARPMDPAWVRALRDQCVRARVPFHFKRWGDWSPALDSSVRGRLVVLGGSTHSATLMTRIGKREGGRKLDGRLWNGLPRPTARNSGSCRAASGRR